LNIIIIILYKIYSKSIRTNFQRRSS